MIVDVEAAGWLAAHALNDVSRADGDEGCCRRCCAPCWAIYRLLQDGQLDALVRPVADGYDWWDEAAGRVDRELLDRAWRMTDCHPATDES